MNARTRTTADAPDDEIDSRNKKATRKTKSWKERKSEFGLTEHRSDKNLSQFDSSLLGKRFHTIDV